MSKFVISKEEKEVVYDCYRKLYKSYLDDLEVRALRWPDTIEEIRACRKLCRNCRDELERLLGCLVDIKAISERQMQKEHKDMLKDFSVSRLFGAGIDDNGRIVLFGR